MLFNEDFLDSLTSDPLAGTMRICVAAVQSVKGGQDWVIQDYANLIEAFTLLSEMAEAKVLPVSYNFPPIQLTQPFAEKCSLLLTSIKEIQEKCEANSEAAALEKLRAKFRVALNSGFKYEFSQGDLEKVQALINELRQEVGASNKLGDEHKARLLRRLEALQSELHKKISDLDKFWGLIGDASVVMAKIGNDAKPIVDRVREIADIVWRTQTRAEELPSGTTLPQIGHTPSNEPPNIDS